MSQLIKLKSQYLVTNLTLCRAPENRLGQQGQQSFTSVLDIFLTLYYMYMFIPLLALGIQQDGGEKNNGRGLCTRKTSLILSPPPSNLLLNVPRRCICCGLF